MLAMQGLNFNVGLWLAFAFIAGIAVDRLLRSRRAERMRKRLDKGDTAFFKGIQYLLSDEPDLAIEQFTKSVQINSETIETYIALGNLYRSKGDIERAIRIRKGIILRPNLEKSIQLRAIFDLGLDYRKGGFVNRALSAFQEVLRSDPRNVGALEQIERIYEDVCDWQSAFNTRQALSRIVKGEHRHILAHHLTELGKVQQKAGDSEMAEKSYKKALSVSDRCVDACLHMGDLYFDQQKYKKALSMWKRVVEVAPHFTFLVYQKLQKVYSAVKDAKEVEDFLMESSRKNPDNLTRLALAQYLYNKGEKESALSELNQIIELYPSFLEARKFKGEVLLKEGKDKEVLAEYRDLLSVVDFPYLKFQCSKCGYRNDKFLWRCPQCLKWDTVGIVSQSPSSLLNENIPS